MLHHQHREPPLVGELAHEPAELLGLAVAEAGGGLVEQQHRRPRRDRARDRHEPSAPVRQLVGPPVEVVHEPELADRGERDRRERVVAGMHEPDQVGERVAPIGRGAQVLVDGHALEQFETLERAAEPGDVRGGAPTTCSTSRPSSSTRADARSTNPVTASIKVVLPAPFGPMSPTTSPGAQRHRHVGDRLDAAESHRHLANVERHRRDAARSRRRSRRPATGRAAAAFAR